LTSSQVARVFKARRCGPGKWRAACPNHGGKYSSPLSIREGEQGRTLVTCFGGCDIYAVLGTVGIEIKDLFADTEWKPSTEMIERYADEERLAMFERQNGLAIIAQAVLPEERNYWRVVEENTSAKIRWIRAKIYPSEKKQQEVQRIIAEYGFDELWECIKHE